MKKQILLFAATIIALYSFAAAPSISSFTPATGPVGTLVTITGTNLSSPTAFTIGGVSAIVVSNTGTTLVGMVMPGAVTGSVSVTTAGGTASGTGSFAVTVTPYPSFQQGPKLVGTGAAISGSVYQGFAVSISADGNTAIVGGYRDSSWLGAAWIYTRSGGVWTQQGPKLLGSGAVGFSIGRNSGVRQGWAVSISADGNTAMVGGNVDSGGTGAVWVYTRSGAVWTQQGPKLVGTGAVNGMNGNGISGASQGSAVSLSADGNTAVVGGSNDSNGLGAIWVFIRSGGVWTQQGPKLVGTGAAYYLGNGSPGCQQGFSVSISADGNTIAEGAEADDSLKGAIWIFTRSGGVWTQQGPKLKGAGATINGNYPQAYSTQQGYVVSLSADGNTVMEGGIGDSSGLGAVWVYTRSGTTWSQQGSKLVATGGIRDFFTNGIKQGCSVSLSADGNTAIVGGSEDSTGKGVFWVYTRSGNTWTQQGAKHKGRGGVGQVDFGIGASLSADGMTAIIGGLLDNSGIGAAWIFSNDTPVSCADTIITLSHAMCQGDTFIFGTMHLSQSGTYRDTLTRAGGCDSIITLTLTVHSLPVVTLTWQSLVQQQDLLVWNLDTAWCDYAGSPDFFRLSGGQPLGGIYTGNNIQNDSFIFRHYVSVDTIVYIYHDSNGCAGNTIRYLPLQICEGISNITSTSAISLYPNPNHGSFTLQTSNNNGEYTITDMLGNIVAQRAITSSIQIIDLPEASEGVYTLVLKGSQPVRFVVIKN